MKKIPSIIKQKLRDRYGDKCFYCHLGQYEHTDHYIPCYNGGLDTEDNLRPACRRCNLLKGKRSPEEFNQILLERGIIKMSHTYEDVKTYMQNAVKSLGVVCLADIVKLVSSVEETYNDKAMMPSGDEKDLSQVLRIYIGSNKDNKDALICKISDKNPKCRGKTGEITCTITNKSRLRLQLPNPFKKKYNCSDLSIDKIGPLLSPSDKERLDRLLAPKAV